MARDEEGIAPERPGGELDKCAVADAVTEQRPTVRRNAGGLAAE